MERNHFTGVIAIAALILMSFGMVVNYDAAAQPQQPQQQQGQFESQEGGFRLQVPEGWVIQDGDDIIDSTTLDSGSEDVAVLCPEKDALPGIGGAHNCQAANLTDSIFITRWSDLQSRPEFENASSSNNGVITPTTDDMVALWVRYLQNVSASQIKIVNATDVNGFTRIVNMTYQVVNKAGTLLPFDDYTYGVKAAVMLALSQDRNTGYSIVNALSDHNIYNRTEFSPAVKEVFDSFELIE
jgi:hypothetical protein